MSQTLNALYNPTAWRTILSRVLELGAERIAKKRDSSLKGELHLEANDGNQAASPPRVWPIPGATKTIDRPYSNIPGRRRIPKLVNANRVPFLRLKKPQPAFLSRIIRDTIKTRERRIGLSNNLIPQVSIAKTEDTWDEILFQKFGLEAGENDKPASNEYDWDETMSDTPGTGVGFDEKGWSYEVVQALQENQRLQGLAVQRRTDISKCMHSIVEQEKELAAEEQERAKIEKSNSINTRRLAQELKPLPVHGQGRSLDITNKLPDGIKQGVTVHHQEKFKTQNDIEKLQSESNVSRMEDEIAAIKAARIKRKEDKAKHKAEKLKKKFESQILAREVG